MVFSLLAAFLFACSGVCAQRSVSFLGPVKANTLRLGLACVVLGLWGWLSGGVHFDSEGARRLYLSGIVGFGIGDMALFFAMPRLGARLTLLINLCTAPVFGVIGDFLLMGTKLQGLHALACGIILVGVCLALLGRSLPNHHTSGSRLIGLCAALTAGAGQGTGATLSRWAHVAENAEGVVLASHVETLLRVMPGFGVVALFWLVSRTLYPHAAWAVEKSMSRRALAWTSANAFCGAILGVTFFQHALVHANSAVVLSVTATTPILVMPMTAYSEGDWPSPKSLVGAAIAVTGVVLLRLGT